MLTKIRQAVVDARRAVGGQGEEAVARSALERLGYPGVTGLSETGRALERVKRWCREQGLMEQGDDVVGGGGIYAGMTVRGVVEQVWREFGPWQEDVAVAVVLRRLGVEDVDAGPERLGQGVKSVREAVDRRLRECRLEEASRKAQRLLSRREARSRMRDRGDDVKLTREEGRRLDFFRGKAKL